MSWQYNKNKKWYNFSNEVQKNIDEKYNNKYGYIDFIDDINFPEDTITIIFDLDNNNNHKLQVIDEEMKVRKIET